MKEDELFFAEEFCFFSAFNKRETTGLTLSNDR